MSDPTHSPSWLLYGANGYTGELIAREAKARGLKPVLAGRSRAKLEPLAKELGFDFKVFDLADPHAVAEQRKKLAMAVPWGDVSTAFHSTGIPNVTVYFPTSRLEILGAKLVNHVGFVLRSRAWRSLVDKAVRLAYRGPDEQTRAVSPSYIWGEAVNAKGERRTALLKTANGYSLTVTGALAVVEPLLDPTHAASTEGGSYTPSRLLGAELVASLPNGGQIRIQ